MSQTVAETTTTEKLLESTGGSNVSSATTRTTPVIELNPNTEDLVEEDELPVSSTGSEALAREESSEQLSSSPPSSQVMTTFEIEKPVVKFDLVKGMKMILFCT